MRWRAITSTALHHLAYAAIITTEAVIGALCTSGAWGQAQHATGAATDTAAAVGAVQMSLAGLGLGFLLFFFGFVCVGAEWFYMWCVAILSPGPPAALPSDPLSPRRPCRVCRSVCELLA